VTDLAPAGPGPTKSGGSGLTGLTVRAVAGITLGIAAGMLILRQQPAWSQPVLSVADALVRAWTNAFRVLVVPLVLAQLYMAVGVGRTSKAVVGRLGLATPLVFAGLMAVTALFSTGLIIWLMSLPSLAGLSLPQPGNNSVAGAAQIAEQATGSWVDGFIPPDLFGANHLLPLMIFTVGFGLAARRLPAAMQETLLAGFGAVRAAMFILVEWLLVATPVVLFGLGLTSAALSGARIGGALLAFTGVESLVLVAALLLLYPLTTLLGGVSWRWLVRALMPAQFTAAATRSSLATIPALLASAETGPGQARVFASYVLPLGGAMLKLSRSVTSPVKLLFLSHLLNIPLSAEQVVIFAATVILISPATVGVPRVTPATRSLPAYVAAGIPAEYVLLLGAATAVTDVFQTLLNTTGYMSANVLIGRFAAPREVIAAAVTAPAPVGPQWAEGQPAGDSQ